MKSILCMLVDIGLKGKSKVEIQCHLNERTHFP